MPFTTPDHPRIAWTLHGRQGPPVLMIMGLGMRGRVWRPLVERLDADHRPITFDNRGIGESEAAPGRWTMRDMASDAVRVLDAAGWRTAHVVGVSMGGMVAQELALGWPERLRSLTLISTHAGGPCAKLPPARGLRGFLEVNLLPPAQRVHAIAYLLYPAEFLRTIDREAVMERMAEQVGDRAPPGPRLEQVLAVLRHDTRDRLGALRTPTMVVRSGDDRLVSPREQARLAALVPGARVVTYDRAGHGVIFQCAGALSGELRRWIARHEPAPGAR